MTPFVNNYDGLVEDLEKNGLKKDEDFFVWNYDWRRPISDIENKFNTFVNSKNISDTDEIYLVGHSLGGVVARIWGQDHQNDQRLKKVIDLGSPNLGSLDAYSVWNGGVVVDIFKNFDSVMLQVLLSLENKSLIPNLDKIRDSVPVVKDLLPTFDNYILKNGKVISQDSLETKNNFLMTENGNVNKITSKLNSSVGVGFSTPNIIRLKDRSIFDKALNLWPDGNLIGYSYGIGDGTVLKSSASFGSTNLMEIISNHGEIVNKSLSFIMFDLGLENKNIDFKYSDNFADSLVIFVGSPATISIKCGNDTFEENNGFVVVKNKKYNECVLNLNPTGSGIIHLVLGNTKNDDWNYIEKNVVLNNPEKILIDFDKAKIETNKQNKNFLISWIKSDLQQIKLNEAIKYLERGDLARVVNMVFIYRSKTKEAVISQRVLDNLFILASIDKPNKKMMNGKWMYINVKFNKRNMSRFSALSWDKLEKLKDDDCVGSEMVDSLSDGYTSEILGN